MSVQDLHHHRHSKVRTRGDCLALCGKTTGCNAVAFRAFHRGGRCVLKDLKPSFRASADKGVSAYRICPNADSCGEKGDACCAETKCAAGLKCSDGACLPKSDSCGSHNERPCKPTPSSTGCGEWKSEREVNTKPFMRLKSKDRHWYASCFLMIKFPL